MSVGGDNHASLATSHQGPGFLAPACSDDSASVIRDASRRETQQLQVHGWDTVSILGSGQSARVYLARRVDTSRGGAEHYTATAAVKVFADSVCSKRQGQEEYEALQLLQHSGISVTPRLVAPPFNLGGEYGQLCIPLQVCSGTLAALAGAPCPISVVAGLSQRLLRALAALHAMGCVHADVKPANILWCAEEADIKLSDLGLSYWLVSAQTAAPIALNCIASKGYRAPEAIEWNDMSTEKRRTQATAGRRCGTAVDVWSAGAVLLEMLLGKRLASIGDAQTDQEAADKALSAVAQTHKSDKQREWIQWLSYLLFSDAARRPSCREALIRMVWAGSGPDISLAVETGWPSLLPSRFLLVRGMFDSAQPVCAATSTQQEGSEDICIDAEDACSDFGKVVKVSVLPCSPPLQEELCHGLVLVEMADVRSCKAARSGLSELTYQGRPLLVCFWVPHIDATAVCPAHSKA